MLLAVELGGGGCWGGGGLGLHYFKWILCCMLMSMFKNHGKWINILH